MARTRITAEIVGDEDFALIVEKRGAFFLREHRLDDGELLKWRPGENVWEPVETLQSLLEQLRSSGGAK